MYKVVIFDSDGMLIHGPRFSEKYASEYNVSIDTMTPFFRNSFEKCLVGNADLKEELQKGWLKKWQWNGSVNELLDYWFSVGGQLNKEVFDSVSKLRSKGIICILATNQEKYRTEHLSKTFGFVEVFDKVFSSAHVGYKKSNPKFLDHVMKYISDIDNPIEKQHVIFWDDDSENIDKIKNYGLETKLFVNTKQFQKEMKKIHLL